MSPSLSPTVNRLIADALKALPEATLVNYASIDNSAVDAACAQAAGQPAELLFDLSKAKVICCFDSDLLGIDPNSALYNRQFSVGRNPDPATMNRLYSIESRYSVTGAAADFRLPVKSSEIEAFLAKVEKRIGEMMDNNSKAVEAAADEKSFDEVDATEQVNRAVEAIAEDLVKSKGAAVVAVGAHLPLNVQLSALRLNKKLESIGKTVLLMPSRSAIEGVKPTTLADFATKAQGKAFDTVWILGDNPVYGAPVDVDVAGALKGIANTIYATDYNDETAQHCSWSVPTAHQLESWGDVRGVDGSYGIGQPQIDPLLGGKSLVEILATLTGVPGTAVEHVKKTAAGLVKGLTERGFNEALHDGFVKGVTSEGLSLTGDVSSALVDGAIDISAVDENRLELVLFTSDALYDGRFANNVWLQELPQVTTRLVWDNAALISPETAKKLGVSQGELVVIRTGETS